jgi:hypothetical protein
MLCQMNGFGRLIDMRKLAAVAVMGIVALGALAIALIYWETRPPAPAPAPVVTSDPVAPSPVAPPAPADSPSSPTSLQPDVPERGRAIPAGDLQVHLESADPDERKDALVEARGQKRAGSMDWLNRNTARRAAAAAPQK